MPTTLHNHNVFIHGAQIIKYCQSVNYPRMLKNKDIKKCSEEKKMMYYSGRDVH